jgi:hypothetical protein
VLDAVIRLTAPEPVPARRLADRGLGRVGAVGAQYFFAVYFAVYKELEPG